MRVVFCVLLAVFPLGVLRAEQSPEHDVIDDAIESYARLLSEPDSVSDIVKQSRNLGVWMRLLWKRNKPDTEEESGDRITALKAGRNFLQTTKKQAEAGLAGETLEAVKRIEDLVMEYEMELDWEKKLSRYLGIYEKSEDGAEKEDTLFAIIKLLMEHKEYKRATEHCREFLKKENAFSKFRKAQVLLWLGNCQEQQGLMDDAIGSYALNWSTYMGMIEASAPAMEAWMRLLWKRNTPGGDGVMSDRQGAYEGGRQYIEMTGRFEDKMREADHRLWQRVKDLVEAYEELLGRRELNADPSIRTPPR